MGFPTGTNPMTEADAQTQLLPKYQSSFALPSSDTNLNTIFSTGFCRRIIPSASGTLYTKLVGDVAAGNGFSPVPVVAGMPLDGEFAFIGGTTTGSTAMTVVVQL